MPNQYVNHVVVDGVTKVDMRSDTITPENVIEGYSFHKADGSTALGTLTHLTDAEIDEITGTALMGVDGDNLAYGGAYVGTAIVGSAVLAS